MKSGPEKSSHPMKMRLSEAAIFLHTANFDTAKWDKYNFNEYMEGPTFCTEHLGVNIDWQLVLFPQGLEVTAGENQIFLGLKQLTESNLPLNLRIDASVRLTTGGEENIWNQELNVTEGLVWNISDSIGRSLADLREKRYLQPGNFLLISAIVSLEKGAFDMSRILLEKIEALNSPQGETNARLYELMEKCAGDTYPDYKLCSKDDEGQLPCHRAILACRLPEYFGAMFKNEMKEKSENCATLPFQGDIVREVLHFIYTDRVSKNFKNLPLADLLEAAGLVQLKKLTAICEKELFDSFKIGVPESEEHVAEVLSLGFKYELAILLDKAMNAVVRADNMEAILKLVTPAVVSEIMKFQSALLRAPPIPYRLAKAVFGPAAK